MRKLDKSAQARILRAVEILREEPRPPASKQLVGGDGERRIRTGDYRIVYEVRDEELVVLVIRVGHRREVYRQH
ncbi:type II toxin-antitoxin system RelE/ParE family toxin [Arthrobacter sp. CAU 1506]|nr:type II toxin-antitoxin system RelE/ParE family toxin [Arthrobacter sp. CAU 1506]